MPIDGPQASLPLASLSRSDLRQGAAGGSQIPQILLLIVGVAGAIVSALALDESPVWARRGVICFGTIGVVGFILTFISWF